MTVFLGLFLTYLQRTYKKPSVKYIYPTLTQIYMTLVRVCLGEHSVCVWSRALRLDV